MKAARDEAQRWASFQIVCGFPDPEREAWVLGFMRDLQQDDRGAYVNFVVDEGPQRVHDAYPGSTYDRLARIKAEYDPGNLFRLNQNVPPAAG